MASKEEKTVNAIKMLGIDMINNAGEGHPGIVLGATPIIYSLYANVLNTYAKNPRWINRDRFILSAGHGSAMLYSMLHFAGYDITMDDLKRFSQVDSFTPAHPEINVDLGIECSTGLLGEGIANAVGIALGERYLENLCKSYDKKCKLIDFYTYVLCSDGDLQEGISYEALSFASKQKLNKLIIIYDYNGVQHDGKVENSFSEELEDRFESLGFNIIDVDDSTNIHDITSALNKAKKSDMPSIIAVKTILGKDAKDAGSSKIHSGILNDEETKNLKKKYKLNMEPFSYDETQKELLIENILKRVQKKYNEWLIEYQKWQNSQNSDITKMIKLLEKGEFTVDFDSQNYKINDTYFEEEIASNYKTINFIAPKTKFLISSSADLATSTKVVIDKSRNMTDENPTGRNIAFGVREHAMGSIMNGLSLLGIRSITSTHLCFSDYMKMSMRMSSMMNLPVTYVFTHDSVFVKGGKTHGSVEQLSSLRLIPNMTVIRPADINEVIGAWEYILKNKGTYSLIISKEKLGVLKHSNGKYVQYGAYIVRKEKYHLDGVIIATGSDVHTALKVAEELFTSGVDLRVVSMPSMELFLKQNPIYEEKLFPKEVKIITLEAGSTMLWNRFASDKDCTVGIDTFGNSGKKEDVAKFVGYDYNSILIKIKKMFESD